MESHTTKNVEGTFFVSVSETETNTLLKGETKTAASVCVEGNNRQAIAYSCRMSKKSKILRGSKIPPLVSKAAHTHPNFHFFAPRDISSVVLAQHHRIANDDAHTHTSTESEMFQKEKYGEILAR